MLVASDQLTDKDHEAVDKIKGDLLMLAGATLYGFSRWFLGPFESAFADTRVISERCRRVFRAPVAIIRGRGPAWDVGYAHQRHPSGRPRAQ